MSRAAYNIPAAPLEVATEVKKSRFIARALYVQSRDEVMVAVEQAKVDHPEARHHCWAYLLGAPQSALNAGMSDDGEPSGTAGKPILNVLQHKSVGDVAVVVIRYFGGIKLGAGGLVRAYSGATEAVVSALELKPLIPKLQRWLRMDYSQEQNLRHWASQHAAEVLEVGYSDGVEMQLQFETAELIELEAHCLALGIQCRESA